MLFDYFYLVLVYIMLSYQSQALCNKFLYFCLEIRHGSLKVVVGGFFGWFVVVVWVLIFFFP